MEVGVKKCALLFRTHIWPFNETARHKNINLLSCWSQYLEGITKYNEREDRKFDFDLWVLYDNTGRDVGANPTAANVHLCSVADVKAHGFIHSRSEKFSPFARGRVGNCDNLLWYNGEYPVLDFYIRGDSAYAQYWMFEYDVVPHTNFDEYLAAFDDVDADFLAYCIKYKSKTPRWMWWNKLDGFDFDEQVGSFFPVTRFSNKAVATLVDYYRKGAHGFCEVLAPTVIYNAGLTVDSCLKHHPKKCKLVHVHKNMLKTR